MNQLTILDVLFLAVGCFAEPSWNEFKTNYGKEYPTLDEEATRNANYERNVDIIRNHNILAESGLKQYTLGINKYADLSRDEISALFSAINIPSGPKRSKRDIRDNKTTPPTSIDWRTRGLVTPVLDAGLGGISSIYATVGATETQLAMVTKKLTVLSIQQVVDCISNVNPSISEVYDFVGRNQTCFETDADYPRTENPEQCKFDPKKVHCVMSQVEEITSGPGRGDIMLTWALLFGTQSVYINAQPDLAFYKSGIYSNPNCLTHSPNHAVLAVGYGNDTVGGGDYYILKNNWGTTWGEEGYMRIARNDGNMCGVGSWMSWPTIRPL